MTFWIIVISNSHHLQALPCPKVVIFVRAFEYFIVLGIYNFGKTHLRTEKTLAILPIALILFRITSFLSLACAETGKRKKKFIWKVRNPKHSHPWKPETDAPLHSVRNWGKMVASMSCHFFSQVVIHFFTVKLQVQTHVSN